VIIKCGWGGVGWGGGGGGSLSKGEQIRGSSSSFFFSFFVPLLPSSQMAVLSLASHIVFSYFILLFLQALLSFCSTSWPVSTWSPTIVCENSSSSLKPKIQLWRMQQVRINGLVSWFYFSMQQRCNDPKSSNDLGLDCK
jgi:hypothetical protein